MRCGGQDCARRQLASSDGGTGGWGEGGERDMRSSTVASCRITQVHAERRTAEREGQVGSRQQIPTPPPCGRRAYAGPDVCGGVTVSLLRRTPACSTSPACCCALQDRYRYIGLLHRLFGARDHPIRGSLVAAFSFSETRSFSAFTHSRSRARRQVSASPSRGRMAAGRLGERCLSCRSRHLTGSSHQPDGCPGFRFG